jgi:hypothetical protein
MKRRRGRNITPAELSFQNVDPELPANKYQHACRDQDDGASNGDNFGVFGEPNEDLPCAGICGDNRSHKQFRRTRLDLNYTSRDQSTLLANAYFRSIQSFG